MQDTAMFEAIGGASYNELVSRLIASLGEDATPVKSLSRAASSPYSSAPTPTIPSTSVATPSTSAATSSTATPLLFMGGPTSAGLPPTAEVNSCRSRLARLSTSCCRHILIAERGKRFDRTCPVLAQLCSVSIPCAESGCCQRCKQRPSWKICAPSSDCIDEGASPEQGAKFTLDDEEEEDEEAGLMPLRRSSGSFSKRLEAALVLSAGTAQGGAGSDSSPSGKGSQGIPPAITPNSEAAKAFDSALVTPGHSRGVRQQAGTLLSGPESDQQWHSPPAAQSVGVTGGAFTLSFDTHSCLLAHQYCAQTGSGTARLQHSHWE